METKGLLYSGGVESAYLLQTLEGTVQPVYVSYGFPWEEYERKAAREHVERVEGARELIEIDVSHDDPSRLRRDAEPNEKDFTYVHGRSASLLTNAAVELSATGITDIYEGTLASGEESFRDSSPEFYESIERALSLGIDDSIEIHLPLYGMDKAEVTAEFIEMDGTIDLDETVSCIVTDDAGGCGDCYKCKERARALERARELV